MSQADTVVFRNGKMAMSSPCFLNCLRTCPAIIAMLMSMLANTAGPTITVSFNKQNLVLLTMQPISSTSWEPSAMN